MNSQKITDVRVVDAQLTFIPVLTRVPLKFGRETVNDVTGRASS